MIFIASGVKKISRTLYISDLDGTLLDPSGEVTAVTAGLINSLTERGMSFTFATARSVYSAAPITSPLKINVPCILMNGVSIYDLSGRRYIKNEFVPEKASAEVIRLFKEAGIHCFMYKIHQDVLTCYFTEITTQVMRSFAEVRRKKYSKPFVQLSDLMDAADSETVYFTTTGEYEMLLPVKEAAENVPRTDCAFYEDSYTHKWYLEIFSADASKANGIKFLREKYGFERVVCFGDNLNDLPMFSQADIRVAPANAKPEVMAAADYIAKANSEDGIARWLIENYV